MISVKDLENGMWQFTLDHAIVVNKNLYKVSFCTSSKQDLMRRVFARASGVYKVVDEKEVEKEMEKKFLTYSIQRRHQKRIDNREKRIQSLPKFKRSIIIVLRRVTNILIKKWV